MSNNIPQKPYKPLTPFGIFVKHNFPFIEGTYEARDNYDLLCKVYQQLKTVEYNQKIGEENIKALYEFLNTLDLQDEVNNKLDEMAESGELQEIMASYLNSKAVFGFDTVNDLKNATNLIDGSYAKTLGYYNINDGGSASYKIRTITNEDIVNNIDLIALENDNTLIAELIPQSESINILQLGCIGNNTFDNTTRIQRGIDKYNNIYIPKGKFLISDTLIYKRFTKIIGENKQDSVIIMSPTIEKTILESYDFNNLKGNPSPYWQWDDRTICFFEFKNFRIDGNYRDASNIIQKNIGNGINNYGASYIIDNVYIDNCAGIGFFNQWTNPTTAQPNFRAGNQITKISIDINNCGEEGLVNDLGDSQFERLFMGNCGIKGTSNYMNDNTCCHSVIMEKGCEIGEWHIYGGTKGYGVYLNNATRFRAKSLIIESCCGGLYVSNTTHYGQVTNLQLHNMLYTNESYEGDFHYIDYNGTRPFLVTNCTIQEYADSTDLDLIYITNSDLSIYNLYCFTNIYKTKSVIKGNANNQGYIPRATIKGTIENCNLVISGTIGNACNIELNIINCNRVVEPSFTIGNGSKVKFTGQLYNSQKFSEDILTTTPRKGCFEMNMRIGDTDMIYPGFTNTVIPDLSTANTNKYTSVNYDLPFKLNENDIIFYMYKLSEGNWGDVNISIITRDQQINQTTGKPYAPIKYIYSGTAPTGHDYRIIGKYGL